MAESVVKDDGNVVIDGVGGNIGEDGVSVGENSKVNILVENGCEKDGLNVDGLEDIKEVMWRKDYIRYFRTHFD